jgi:calmodulin
MRAVGLVPSDDELANMITEVDGSGKGAVDFAEFMSMMSKNGTSTAAEIKETFTLFNGSGSGTISADDLGSILGRLGDAADAKEIQEMIELADVSKNGGVNFQDFETIMLD